MGIINEIELGLLNYKIENNISECEFTLKQVCGESENYRRYAWKNIWHKAEMQLEQI